MKTKLPSTFVLIVIGLVILITCKKKDTVLSPVANAGPDLVITLPTDSVLLDGSASNSPNGTIDKWLWTRISGPASFAISNSSANKTQVKNLIAGIYKFELKVTNNGNLTATDEITITVIPRPIQQSNIPPVANAGIDTTIKVVTCDSKGSANLDGGKSSDPDNYLTNYQWSQISGPSAAAIANPLSPKTTALNLLTGAYVFQLQVWNVKGLSSKDTVMVIVNSELTVSNLDLTISGGFNFVNNYEDCYYGPPCYYYDNTSIYIQFNFPQFGQFNFSVYEVADTASTSDAHDTYMALNPVNGNGPRVWGTCSINFKKIIQKGGGAFSGTFKIENGSAEKCDPNIYKSSDPLAITGSIDTTAHTINLTIKGKTYF